MALINCHECNKEISDKATACPQCGYPITENKSFTEKPSNDNWKEGDAQGYGKPFIVSAQPQKKKERSNTAKFVIAVIVLVFLATFFLKEKNTKSVSPPGEIITKYEYGNEWPYTVDVGRLYCDPPGSNVVLNSKGKIYALNGRALGNAEKRGYIDSRKTITLRDENGYFTIGSTAEIIRRGLTMCD